MLASSISQPLQVHAGPDEKKWVGSSFNAFSTKMIEYEEEDPFGEKYKQSWPATPYSVRVKSNADSAVFGEVFVDEKKLADTSSFRATAVMRSRSRGSRQTSESFLTSMTRSASFCSRCPEPRFVAGARRPRRPGTPTSAPSR